MASQTFRRWENAAPGRSNLGLRQVSADDLPEGHVRVSVEAVSLNYRDRMIIDDGWNSPVTYPFTPCSDMAGTVVETAVDVEGLGEGDRVISVFNPDWQAGMRPGNAQDPSYRTLGGFYPGVLSESMVVPASWVVRAPARLDAVHASTLPCAGVTAWFALVERGRVNAADTVVIEGTGGVSLFGLQIAKVHGARVLVSTTTAKAQLARDLGADEIIIRGGRPLSEDVFRLTDSRGADQVLEVVGGRHLEQAVASAAVGGHVHLIGSLEGFEVSSTLMPVLLKDLTIHGVGVGHREATEALVRAVDHAAIEPVVDSVYDFDDLHGTLDRMDSGAVGKVVVRVTDSV